MAALAPVMQRHRPDVLAHLRHRATNAVLEGVNAVIQ
jgi:transposase